MGVFTGEQPARLLDISIDDEHLFYELGKEEDDSVVSARCTKYKAFMRGEL